MLKFLCEDDQIQYEVELKLSGMTNEGFIKAQREKVDKFKDFRKSQNAKQVWREHKPEIMSGIRKFHHSTQGKRFHRNLGRFLAMRTMGESLTVSEKQKLMVSLSSLKTHILINSNGGDYYLPFNEAVNFETLRYVSDDIIIDIYQKVGNLIGEGRVELTETEEDFLVSVVEATALIKSFSEQTGKTEEEVEKLWKEAKKQTNKEYDMKEENERFYPITVGILKKMLKLK